MDKSFELQDGVGVGATPQQIPELAQRPRTEAAPVPLNPAYQRTRVPARMVIDRMMQPHSSFIDSLNNRTEAQNG
jgi:hypothetical protein